MGKAAQSNDIVCSFTTHDEKKFCKKKERADEKELLDDLEPPYVNHFLLCFCNVAEVQSEGEPEDCTVTFYVQGEALQFYFNQFNIQSVLAEEGNSYERVKVVF